jgi:hypothetical protein
VTHGRSAFDDRPGFTVTTGADWRIVLQELGGLGKAPKSTLGVDGQRRMI